VPGTISLIGSGARAVKPMSMGWIRGAVDWEFRWPIP
jgi:hypothetical protein